MENIINAKEPPREVYTLEKSLTTPAHVSSLAFGHAGHLFVGSDDGSLRVYDLSTFKVIKAIRGLDAEISSVVCVKRAGSDLRDAWIAHGKTISKFQMASEKMVQTFEDAVISIKVGQDETENDILNELALNADKSNLAFSLDSGVVGVVNISPGGNNAITRMDTKHDSVCDTVKFVPERPRELVSGGYDTIFLHHDVVQNKLLSKRQIDPFSPSGGMQLSPPFIMCMAVSITGVLTAGTADGRLWIGFAGEKTEPKAPEAPSISFDGVPVTDLDSTGGVLQNSAVKLTKKKSKSKSKPKKWEGLDEDEALNIKVAEGPIVAMAFTGSRILTVSTLMGIITQFFLIYDEENGSVLLQQVWQKESKSLEKVNALIADDKRIIVGGFEKKGKGVIEVWKLQIAGSAKNTEQLKEESIINAEGNA